MSVLITGQPVPCYRCTAHARECHHLNVDATQAEKEAWMHGYAAALQPETGEQERSAGRRQRNVECVMEWLFEAGISPALVVAALRGLGVRTAELLFAEQRLRDDARHAQTGELR